MKNWIRFRYIVFFQMTQCFWSHWPIYSILKKKKKIKCAHLMTECSSAHEENEKKKMGFPTNLNAFYFDGVYMYVVSTTFFQIFKYMNILTHQIWMLPVVFELVRLCRNKVGKSTYTYFVFKTLFHKTFWEWKVWTVSWFSISSI